MVATLIHGEQKRMVDIARPHGFGLYEFSIDMEIFYYFFAKYLVHIVFFCMEISFSSVTSHTNENTRDYMRNRYYINKFFTKGASQMENKNQTRESFDRFGK